MSTEPSEAHRPMIRSKLDLIVPVAALFVSFVSILIAWYSASIEKQMARQNERMVQASSLPHLNSSVGSMNRANGTKQIILRLTNGGVGPAEIRSVELLFDGHPMPNITELLQSCCGISGGELSLVNLTNRMIRPGETVEYLDINDSRGDDKAYSAGVDRFFEAVAAQRIATKLCYCSVFGECWTIERPSQRPHPVALCTVPKVPYQ